MTTPNLITAGVIADALDVNADRVRHILRTRRHIKPVAYAGHTRLFTSEAIAQVRHELNATGARRAGGER